MSAPRTTLALSIAATLLVAAAWRASPSPARDGVRGGNDEAPPTPVGAASSSRADRAKTGSDLRRGPSLARRARGVGLPEPLPAANVAPGQASIGGSPAPPTCLPGRSSPVVSADADPPSAGTGEVLVGPPRRTTAAGRVAANEPGLRALERLGIDLDRPDEALRRLVEEYRAALGSPDADTARMAWLDQGMAAIARSYPETSDLLFTLFVQERHRAMGRTLAYLLRDARRTDQEPPLVLMAAADPDDARRANALAALAPAANDAIFQVLLSALDDESAVVRLASAEAIETSISARPGLREGNGVATRLNEATAGETDAAVRGILERLAPRP